MERSNPRFAHTALRLGAAFAFLYPPVSAIFDPYSWIGYFPAFMRALPLDQMILLHLFGALEIIIALWLLSGYKIRIPALVATLLLFAIVLFNFGQLEVLFRDLSIAALTLALAAWPEPACS